MASMNHAQALDLVVKAGQSLTQSNDLAAVLDEIVTCARQIAGAESGACTGHIAFVEDNHLHTLAATDTTDMPPVVHLDDPRCGLRGEVIRAGEPVVVADVRLSPRAAPPGVMSQAVLPLKVREDVVGVLAVDSPMPDAFPPHTIQSLALLANLAAIAYDNNRHQEIAEREANRAGITRSILFIEKAQQEAEVARLKAAKSDAELKFAGSRLKLVLREKERADKLNKTTFGIIRVFSAFSDVALSDTPVQTFRDHLAESLPEICLLLGADAGMILEELPRRKQFFQVLAQSPEADPLPGQPFRFYEDEWHRLSRNSGGIYLNALEHFGKTHRSMLPFQAWSFLNPEKTDVAVLLIGGVLEDSKLLLTLVRARRADEADSGLTFRLQNEVFGFVALRLRELYSVALQAEAQLRYERDRQQFIQDVVHQLVGPIGGLKGDAEALVMGMLPPEKQKETLERMLEQGSMLQGYAISFSLAAQSTSFFDMFPNAFKPFSAAELVALLVKYTKSFQGQTRYYQIDGPRVAAESFAAFPTLRIHEDHFGIMILNLYDNAVKYSMRYRNAPIVVEGSIHNDYVEIALTNHGIPLSADDIDIIFERYRRSQTAERFEQSGTGIGLYLCDKIVKLHDGIISVQPSTPSPLIDGAHEVRFAIQLPIPD